MYAVLMKHLCCFGRVQCCCMLRDVLMEVTKCSHGVCVYEVHEFDMFAVFPVV